jgi:hypothetical protein
VLDAPLSPMGAAGGAARRVNYYYLLNAQKTW